MISKKRLLAAIMFADMVGYTKLMQENENRAKENRDKVRETLEKSVSEGAGFFWTMTHSLFKKVKDNPQFKMILKK